MKLHLIWLWVAAAVCLLPSCTPLESQSVEYVRDDSRSLRRALFDHGKMVLVYGTAEKHKSEYAQWAKQLAENSQRIKIAVYSDQNIHENELTQNPVFLVGSFSQNSIVKDFIQRLPFTRDDGTFGYQGVKIQSENDLGILSFYPNPYAPHFPVGAVLGTDDQEILTFIKQHEGSRIFRTLWSRWGYQIYQNGQRTLLGNFNQDWQPDSLQKWTFSHDLTPAIETQHFQIYSYAEGLSSKDLSQISQNCEARIHEMISFVNNGKEQTIPKIGMYIYPSAEQMGLMHNQMSQSFIDPARNEAHVIINEEYIGNYVEKENQLVLTYLLGKSSLSALEEGMAIYFAPQWQQKGYLHWSAALTRSHNIIPLKELLDPNYYQEESPLVRGAMAGSLVGFLIQNWGKEEFIRRYSSWQPGSNEIASLEKDWISYLHNEADQIPRQERRSYQNQYFKGMTFSHEGYNIYDGYGSKIGAASLEAIKSIYANAVAIVPYSGSRNIYSPAPFHFSEGAGGENDASVVCSHHSAKQLGLMTMLKPQLWFPGAWPGEVEMKTEEEWEQFFNFYRRWIRHYAMLAEIHQMDIFCAGVEFVKTTRSHPEKWVELIRDLREIYRGPITYAANWGEEFENFTFSEELDFVGLNFYYPLSGKKNASERDLKKGLEKALEKVREKASEINRPVVLTEIGFRSIAHPWIQPHAEAEDRIKVERDQAMCYEVILDGLRGESWCKGTFWWKWPSQMEYTYQNPTSFTPCGKEAAEVLKKYYQL